MTTRPHPLPGWAIKALDEERLTQWRVPLKVQPAPWATSATTHPGFVEWHGHSDGHSRLQKLPFAPGQVRWVQETWAQYPVEFDPEPGDIWHKADGRSPPITTRPHHWRPPRHHGPLGEPLDAHS